jgi:hypothetical protein
MRALLTLVLATSRTGSGPRGHTLARLRLRAANRPCDTATENGMKKVRVLAGLAGLAPVAIGMAMPVAAQAGTSAGYRAENAPRPGKTISLHPLTGAAAAGLPTCQGAISGSRQSDIGIDVCHGEVINSKWSYVYWTNESVYYPSTQTKTWRLRISGTVTQHHTLKAGRGWHTYVYTNNRRALKICVGASNTLATACESLSK